MPHNPARFLLPRIILPQDFHEVEGRNSALGRMRIVEVQRNLELLLQRVFANFKPSTSAPNVLSVLKIQHNFGISPVNLI